MRMMHGDARERISLQVEMTTTTTGTAMGRALHLLILSVYVFGLFYEFRVLPVPPGRTYIGKLKYLTIWDLVGIDPCNLII